MSCRRCRHDSGVVDGLCGDCSRWTNDFEPEELGALAGALSRARGPVLTKLRLEILAARVDGGLGPFPDLVAARRASVSEAGG